jgi:hypothetical protein
MNEPVTEKEKLLWKQAKKRVAFRRHLFSYIVVNGMLWGIWLFGGREETRELFPWPVWPTMGWGIGLVINFYSAYLDNRADAVEREYEKLKNAGK